MPEAARKMFGTPSIAERIDALDWESAVASLSQRGYAVTTPILSPEECGSLATMYSDDSRFRSQIMMERHRFGVRSEERRVGKECRSLWSRSQEKKKKKGVRMRKPACGLWQRST